MWNKIIKKDNTTLPQEKEQVIFLTSKGEIFTGWKEGIWNTVSCNGKDYKHKPHWYIFGPRGRRMECTTDAVYWMSTPVLPDDFN